MTFPSSFASQRHAARALWISLLGGAAAGAVACGIRTPLTDDIYGPSGKTATQQDAGVVGVATQDAGVDASDGSAPSNDAGDDSAVAAADDGGFDSALPAADLGDIVLTSGAYENGSDPTLTVAAVFYPSVAKTGCSVTPIDGCTIEVCTTLSPGDLAGAGSIAVGGGLYPLVLVESQPGIYEIAPSPDAGVMQLWRGGETLVVSGSGEVAPAFTASLGTPTQITVTTPLPATVPRAAPLAVSWFQASAGNVAVDVQETTGERGYFLECLFPVAGGVGTVPSDALETLPATAAGTLSVHTVTMAEVEASGWSMRVFAQTNANDAAGKEYEGTVGLP